MAKREIVAVFFITNDVESLVHFYRDKLNLEVLRHEPGHSAWFDTKPVPLVIHRPEAGEGPGVDYTPETPVLVWFHPEEGVQQAAQFAEGRGVQLERATSASNYVTSAIRGTGDRLPRAQV